MEQNILPREQLKAEQPPRCNFQEKVDLHSINQSNGQTVINPVLLKLSLFSLSHSLEAGICEVIFCKNKPEPEILHEESGYIYRLA